MLVLPRSLGLRCELLGARLRAVSCRSARWLRALVASQPLPELRKARGEVSDGGGGGDGGDGDGGGALSGMGGADGGWAEGGTVARRAWDVDRPPTNALTAGSLPGACWALEGSRGRLLIQLARPIRPEAFSVAFLPLSLSVDPSSAPRNLSVWGVVPTREGVRVRALDQPGTARVLLARGEYAHTPDGISTFEAAARGDARTAAGEEAGADRTRATSRASAAVTGGPAMPTAAFEYIELAIESNYGHSHYTAVYRFRVHGTPAPVPTRNSSSAHASMS
jgi:hypothetical protein